MKIMFVGLMATTFIFGLGILSIIFLIGKLVIVEAKNNNKLKKIF